MPYEFTLSVKLPAAPQIVFDAWLSSEGHTAMTGGVAHLIRTVGEPYEAWDGYITGRTLEIDPTKRILQTWRTSRFPRETEDSVVEILFTPEGDAETLLTLHHRNVPDDHTSYESSGWQEYYFEPMQRRFKWLRLKDAMQAVAR